MTRLNITKKLLVILVIFIPIFVKCETIRLEREILKTTSIPSTDNNNIVDENSDGKKLHLNETSSNNLNDINLKTKHKGGILAPVDSTSIISTLNDEIQRSQSVETTTQTIKLSPISTPISSRRNLTKLLPLKIHSFNRGINNSIDIALDKSESLDEGKNLLTKIESNISINNDNINSFNDISENNTSQRNDDLNNLEKKTNVNVPIQIARNKTNSISSNHLLESTTRKYKLLFDTDMGQQNTNNTNILNTNEEEKTSLNNPPNTNKNFTETTTDKVFDTKSVENNSSENTTNVHVNNIGNETKSELISNTENIDLQTMKKKEKLLSNSSETINNISSKIPNNEKLSTETTQALTDYVSTVSSLNNTMKTDLRLTSTTELPEESTENLKSVESLQNSIESTTNNLDISITSESSVSTIEDDNEFEFIISTISLGLNDDIFQSTENPGSSTLDSKTDQNSGISTTTEASFDSTLLQITKMDNIISSTVPVTFKPIMEDQLSSEPTTESNFVNINNPSDNDKPTTDIPTTHTTTANIESEATNDNETDYIWIAIGASAIGIIALVLLIFISCYYMKKRAKLTYGQRCRPVSLDAYSLDNISVHNNSVRRGKNGIRDSKKSFGNIAFDDPSLKHNSIGIHELAKFVDKKSTIYEEFRSIPQITARPDEVPQGCEDKNRYANVIPLPETRVILQRQNNDDTTEYINANYVRGPKDTPNYYIACQAPLDNTITDFWRMVWEQNCYVIIMGTDIVENGMEKCSEYLPQSNFINSLVFDNFHITLKNREVKQKYAITTMNVKNSLTNTTREITHFWYKWPEVGVPTDESAIIAMLLEARSCLKMPPNEFSEVNGGNTNPINENSEINNKLDKSKTKIQGPLIVHCSPGTGRTGTIIACDIAIRSLEQTRRIIDIPQFVYYIRRGRASAVQTKEQYEFIYKVSNLYATKISGPINDN